MHRLSMYLDLSDGWSEASPLRRLDDTEAARGFANRFLWACVHRSKLLPEGGDADRLHWSPFHSRLRATVDRARRMDEVRKNPEARRLWATVYPSLTPSQPGLLG